MKHNHNHDNACNTSAQFVPVRFEFTILKGDGLVSALWLAFRSPDRVQKDK